LSKLLAIDFGMKRCGIAVTDDDQLIASGLTTVNSTDLIDFLRTYQIENEVQAFVLGEPKRLDGSDTHSTSNVQKLKEQLEEEFGLNVYLVDERFTSKMAIQTMIDSGLKKKDRQNKALVDEISACIILQSYLESS
jgi:putative holliday junction resolvase